MIIDRAISSRDSRANLESHRLLLLLACAHGRDLRGAAAPAPGASGDLGVPWAGERSNNRERAQAGESERASESRRAPKRRLVSIPRLLSDVDEGDSSRFTFVQFSPLSHLKPRLGNSVTFRSVRKITNTLQEIKNRNTSRAHVVLAVSNPTNQHNSPESSCRQASPISNHTAQFPTKFESTQLRL